MHFIYVNTLTRHIVVVWKFKEGRAKSGLLPLTQNLEACCCYLKRSFEMRLLSNGKHQNKYIAHDVIHISSCFCNFSSGRGILLVIWSGTRGRNAASSSHGAIEDSLCTELEV
ncbi:hypothetical protein TNCV_1666711 [Trichonephila clavipes]|nr:hypothetical protein TNCV_1666711 [Trichonephila clavipes]